MIASELIVGETDAIEVGAGAIVGRRGEAFLRTYEPPHVISNNVVF